MIVTYLTLCCRSRSGRCAASSPRCPRSWRSPRWWTAAPGSGLRRWSFSAARPRPDVDLAVRLHPAWNEFPLVLILNKPERQTLPLWLTGFRSAFGDDWGATMPGRLVFASRSDPVRLPAAQGRRRDDRRRREGLTTVSILIPSGTVNDQLHRDALAVLQPGFVGTTPPDWIRRHLAAGSARSRCSGATSRTPPSSPSSPPPCARRTRTSWSPSTRRAATSPGLEAGRLRLVLAGQPRARRRRRPGADPGRRPRSAASSPQWV